MQGWSKHMYGTQMFQRRCISTLDFQIISEERRRKSENVSFSMAVQASPAFLLPGTFISCDSLWWSALSCPPPSHNQKPWG